MNNTSMEYVLVSIFERGAQHEPFEIDEERQLIDAAQQGCNESVVKLMYAYAPVLRKSLVGFNRANPRASVEEVEDARQQAVLGFYEAIAAFDAASHDRLAATVRHYMTRASDDMAADSSKFYINPRTRSRFFAVLREADGNIDVAAMIAPSHSLSTDNFYAILHALRGGTAFEGPSCDRAEIIGQGAPEDLQTAVETRVMVDLAFAELTEEETRIIRLAFGFDTYDEGLSDAAIAHQLSQPETLADGTTACSPISRAKVQRIRAGSLAKMRQNLVEAA